MAAAAAQPRAFLALLLGVVVWAAGCESRRSVLVPVDAETLEGIYWEPPRELSAGILLVPEAGSRKEDWIPFAQRLQQRGYGVLVIDLRRPEAGGGAAEGETAGADVAAAFAFLRDQRRVDAARLGIIAAGLGADSALRFSAAEPSSQALVLVSPRASAAGVALEAAMAYYGGRPVLLAAGRGEAYRVQVEELARHARGTKAVMLYESEAEGTALLEATPELEQAILDFLDVYLRPPVLDTGEGGS